MQEYLVMLLIILLLMSLVLVAGHSFLKSRIRLRTATVFATIGVTLLLGAFFPWALSAFSLSAVFFIYFGVIILFAFALSYCDVKIPACDPPNPAITEESENEIEEPALIASAAFEFNEKAASMEACAALDCTAPAAAENNMASGTPNKPETQYCDEDAAEEAGMTAAQPAHVPVETTAADLPDKITPDPVQESAITAGQSIPADDSPEAMPEAEPALDATESLDFASDAESVNTSMADGLLAGAEAAYTSESSADDSPGAMLEAEPALDETKSLNFASDAEPLNTLMANGLLTGAEVAYTSESSGELAEDRTAGETSKPATEPELPPETLNDNISAGFAAKASGDMASALVSFMNAFSLNQESHTAVALAVEISNVYRELGQYPQAKLVIKSLLEQEYFNISPVRQQLENHLLYLETFTELLKVAGMPPNAPYSKVPNLVKTKANIDTVEKQKKNSQGGI